MKELLFWLFMLPRVELKKGELDPDFCICPDFLVSLSWPLLYSSLWLSEDESSFFCLLKIVLVIEYLWLFVVVGSPSEKELLAMPWKTFSVDFMPSPKLPIQDSLWLLLPIWGTWIVKDWFCWLIPAAYLSLAPWVSAARHSVRLLRKLLLLF